MPTVIEISKRGILGLAGQPFVKRVLGASITKGPYTSYVFSGPSGVGKSTFAYAFATACACLDLKNDFIPCGVCDSCSRPYDVIGYDLDCSTQFIFIEGSDFDVVKYKMIHDYISVSDGVPVFIFLTTPELRLDNAILSRSIKIEFESLYVNDLVGELNRYGVGNVELIARLAHGNIGEALRLSKQFSLSDDVDVSIGYGIFKMVINLTNAELAAKLNDLNSPLFVYRSLVSMAFGVLMYNNGVVIGSDKVAMYAEIIDIYGASVHAVCDFILHLCPTNSIEALVSDILSLKLALNGINPYLSNKTVRIVSKDDSRRFDSKIDMLKFFGKKSNQSVVDQPKITFEQILDKFNE